MHETSCWCLISISIRLCLAHSESYWFKDSYGKTLKLKGIFHSKMKCLSLFTQPHVIPNMCRTQINIFLKNIGNQTVNTTPMSLSRKLCSLGGHICNTSGQLFQHSKTKSYLLEWENPEIWKNCSPHSNNAFQISNKIWHERSDECFFIGQIALVKAYMSGQCVWV